MTTRQHDLVAVVGGDQVHQRTPSPVPAAPPPIARKGSMDAIAYTARLDLTSTTTLAATLTSVAATARLDAARLEDQAREMRAEAHRLDGKTLSESCTALLREAGIREADAQARRGLADTYDARASTLHPAGRPATTAPMPMPAPPDAGSGPGPEPLPEGLDFDSVEDVFDYGYCNALALALHQLTGWPIVGMVGRGQRDATHYLVRRPDGLLVDAHGARTETAVANQWTPDDPDRNTFKEGYRPEGLWAEVQNGYMEDPADVWPLAQTVAARVTGLPRLDTPVESTMPPAPPLVPAAAALVDAYHRGRTVQREFTAGQNAGLVQLVRLDDGTEAVYKQIGRGSENPHEVTDAYLAGLVAQAIGIDHVTTAILSRTELLSEYVPGVDGRDRISAAGDQAARTMPEDPVVEPWHRPHAEQTARAAAERAEWQRILHARNSREIGLLDFLVDNYDRNDHNYLVDGDTVYPIDHGYAYFGKGLPDQDDTVSLHSPFAQRYLNVDRPSGDDRNERFLNQVPVGNLVSPISEGELADLRSRLEALRPEFEGLHALDKHRFVLDRLALLTAPR